jgi:hypothetical protein
MPCSIVFLMSLVSSLRIGKELVCEDDGSGNIWDAAAYAPALRFRNTHALRLLLVSAGPTTRLMPLRSPHQKDAPLAIDLEL